MQPATPRRRFVVLGLILPLLVACTSDPESPTAPPAEGEIAELTLGLYGMPGAEVEALTSEAERINGETMTRSLTVQATQTPLRESVESGEPLPDLFFASNEDLAWLQHGSLIEPVDAYMVARKVDFGDNYSYDGVQAFTINSRLTCMPYAIDPLVVVYNPELVNWEAMEAEGIATPDSGRWDLSQLQAAAEFASNPETGTKGLYVEPTLDQLAPFILSGGGEVFAEGEPPTSTALSSDESVDALVRMLEVFRNAQITLTPEELEQRSALEWFTSGQLGMMLAPRSMVPELRAVEGLDFDVIFPPTLDTRATIGTAGGICMSVDSDHKEAAADAIVDLSAPEAVSTFAEAGYRVPALLEVAESEAFLQPELLPEASSVYVNNLRWTYFLPPVLDRAAVDEAVAPYLAALLDDAVVNRETIASTTAEIDRAALLALGGDPDAEGDE